MLLATLLFALACRVEHCATAKDVKACKCYGEEPGYTLVVQRGDRQLYRAQQDAPFETEEIEVHRVDLDHDGAEEIVVADLLAVGNGMAVHTWTLVILDGRTNKPTALEVKDYGPGSIRDDGTILETSWDWMGPALYFVARPYTYAHGELKPQTYMWRRRYLFSFERERIDHGNRPGVWLKKAEKVPWKSRDPLE
ncbi:MAG: hypothetical protein JOZ54_15105 [Acidobacteria bacterium]|nr:hypothetical protein [Acidobacteriota bacterium]